MILQTARDVPETGGLSFALRQRLYEALDDRHPNVVAMAAQGLVRLDPDHPRLVPTLIKHLQEGKKAMERATSPWTLETYLENSALLHLSQLGSKAKGAVPVLVEVVENTKLNYLFRQQAITALGNIGPAASEAIPVLREALEGDDRDFLGDEAMKALWKIAPEVLREMVPPEEIDRLKEEIEAQIRASGFPGSLSP
jgi:HEAT repeat protein